MSSLPMPEEIPRHVYDDGKHDRMSYADLEVGELYALYTALDANTDSAAVLPYRFIERIELRHKKLGRITFLDQDLQDHLNVFGEYKQDYFIPNKDIYVPIGNERYAITEAYTRDYYEDHDLASFMAQAIDLKSLVGV